MKISFYQQNFIFVTVEWSKKFQCLFALHPVFGPSPDCEYKYQIGMQLDFTPSDPDLIRKITEMGRVLRLIPQSRYAKPIT